MRTIGKTKKHKLSYWERRQVQNMYQYMQEAEQTADEVAKMYVKASKYISYKSEQIFDRFQTKHRLSDREARNLLHQLQDRTSIIELLNRLKQKQANNEEKEKLLAKLEAPAYQARLEHFRQLQNQVDYVVQNIYQQEKDFTTRYYLDLANEAYYRSIYDMQQRTNAAFCFNFIDVKQINQVLNTKWFGKNYSERIWRNTKALAQDIKEELLINLVTGRTNREVADIIANKFGQGSSNARRLIRTESNYLSTELNFKAYEECRIKKYRYLATLDLRTSETCRELDNKIFLLKDRKIGVNCPPMHPWCRSTTVAVIDDKYIATMKRSAMDPATGKRILVPDSMTYQEWYDKYVANDSKAMLEEKKIKNRSSDRNQYNKYKKLLGEEIPKTLDNFQNTKYDNEKEWTKLQLAYKDQKLRNRLQSDKTNKKVEEGKQGKHILGHNNYTKGRSYLSISLQEVQELVNKYAGTGELKRDNKGNWTNKEFVVTDKIVGVCIDPITGKEKPTTRFSIHYSKRGTHIVPREEEK